MLIVKVKLHKIPASLRSAVHEVDEGEEGLKAVCVGLWTVPTLLYSTLLPRSVSADLSVLAAY